MVTLAITRMNPSHSMHNTTVSILFADICGFTPLTTTLSVSKLVETLNDLFGKFDEAAEVRN